jgi:hypothetical protein
MAPFLFAAVLAAAVSAPKNGTPAQADALVFQPDSTVVAEAYQFGTAEAHYTVRNTGKRPITISKILPRKGRGEGVVDPPTIAPGGTAKITLRRWLERLGYADYVFIASTDDPKSPTYRIVMPAFGQSAYSPEVLQVGFDNVRQGTVSAKTITVESYETTDLRLRSVLEAPPWLQVREMPRAPGAPTQRLTLEVSVRDNAPLGLQQGVVHLASTVANQPDLLIGAYAKVFDDVVANPMPLSFGAAHLGKKLTRSIEYRSIDGSALAIDKTAANGKNTSLASAACGTDCVRVDVTLDPTKRGVVAGVVRAEFKGRKNPVDVPYSALFVEPGTKIEDLGTLGESDVERQSETGESR